NHTSAHTAQNRAFRPSITHQPVQPVCPPYREQVDGVPTTDVENILIGDKVSEIRCASRLPRQARGIKYGQVRRNGASTEGPVESHNIHCRVRARGRDEADLSRLPSSQ